MFQLFTKEANKSQQKELLSQRHLKGSDPLTRSSSTPHQQNIAASNSSEESSRSRLSRVHAHCCCSGSTAQLQAAVTTALKHRITRAEKISLSYKLKCEKLVIEKLQRQLCLVFQTVSENQTIIIILTE